MQFRFRNVNDAFRGLVSGIDDGSIPTRRSPSRVGEVLQVEEPVLVTYTHPRERVLFNAARDANSFFHLFESLWMLAGRNDVAPLAYYNSKIAEIASDDGKTFNGAYGYRWRYASPDNDTWDHNCNGVDQLKIIVDQLKRKPESRRCVLQMWNVRDDLLKIDETKDVCCNTHVYFALREEPQPDWEDDQCHAAKRYLDMTVCNRSNDLVWGMLGANVVHFSFLQEYLAACLGVSVGLYHQFTNNLHVYTERWEPDRWLLDPEVDHYTECDQLHPDPDFCETDTPLVADLETFDRECRAFIDSPRSDWKEPFLRSIARPMCEAFWCCKQRNYGEALSCIGQVLADDWRVAGRKWIERRKLAWEQK